MLALPLILCVNLSMSLNFLEPHFLHLCNGGEKNTYLRG
jgi:hypothetical protein